MSSTGVVLEPPSSKPAHNNHHTHHHHHNHHHHAPSVQNNKNHQQQQQQQQTAHAKNNNSACNNNGGGGGNNNNTSTTSSNSSKRNKSKHDRSGRKRSRSFSGCGLMMNPKPVPPTKFLLGGNINDPLNLNSLQDEDINRAMNAVTPKSSPIPTPPQRKGHVEVIIPPNINDPLNLIGCADDAEYEQQMNSPLKKARKKRLKKRRTISASNLDTSIDLDLTGVTGVIIDGGGSSARTPEVSSDSAKIPDGAEEEKEAVCAAVKTPTPAKNNKELSLELTSPKKDTKSNKRKSEEGATVASSGGGGGGGAGGGGPGANKKFKFHSMDKIVSPVVPQPGAWTNKRTNAILSNKKKPRHNKNANEEMPQFKDKNQRFQYGNYDRYYGYRNPHNEIDHRLRVLSHHRYLFEGKEILDIGCNIGHITLSVARDFRAKNVTGIDIDPKLIAIARKNVKHYVKNSSSSTPSSSTPTSANNMDNNKSNKNGSSCSTNPNASVHDKVLKKKTCEFFPISMPILYGSIDIPGFNDTHYGRDFPNNVIFKMCNYVLEDDSQLSLEQPQFDVILCLSVTKWIHLNWGDAGIKQAFRRMYAQLKPGGKLILEPQNWASYKNKHKLTETIFKNYNSIEFFPEKFTEYLLSSVVGFAKSEIMGYPHHLSRGFQRPVQIFTKSTMFPSERIEATPNNNSITPNNEPTSLSSLYAKNKTEKYESHAQIETSEHIYCTSLLNRFCGDADRDFEVNHLLDEEFHEGEEEGQNREQKTSGATT